MGIKVANNASSTLASGISDSDLSLSVQAGDGSKYPSLGAGDYFYVTLSDGTNIEVVKATARSTDTMTIERAQDGTSNYPFIAGSKVEIRWNVAQIKDYSVITASKTTLTLSVTDISNQYVDMGEQAKTNSLNIVSPGKGPMAEDEDYSVSVVGSKTRITFLNDFAAGGISAFVSNDKMAIKYSV